MNSKKILIVYLLVAGLMLTPAVFSFGQTSTSNETSSQLALTQNEEKNKKTETIIEQIQKSLEKLFLVKEENELSDEQKNLQEVDAGKQVLKEIIDLSIKENQELLEKTKKLIDSEEYQKIINEDLQQVDLWYSEINKKIDDVKTQDDVKNLAQSIKDWRQNVYGSATQRALSTILVSQETKIIELAKKRLERIKADLKKLEGLGFNTSKLQKLLNQAGENIESGYLINKEAESVLTTLFLGATSTTSTIEESSSTSTSIKSETIPASTTPIEKIPISSVVSSTAETSTDQNQDQENKAVIKDLVIKSNDKIKAAYVLFLEMADLVRSGSL